MKGQLQSALPWAWCYSHCLEMACKDALTSPFFANINEMLLRLNHLYKKSPKELTMIVEELKEVYQFRKGGSLPVRCQGTRWISYKGKALQRVVDRFGAYDLAALIEDSTVKKVSDRARLKGYL